MDSVLDSDHAAVMVHTDLFIAPQVSNPVPIMSTSTSTIKPLRVLIIGDTTEGKSTLINALMEAHDEEQDRPETVTSN